MIKVSNLHFRYKDNNTSTLNNLNLEIPKGEIFGFLGPSGAGKSTTVKILIGLLAGFEGKVSIGDFQLPSKTRDLYEDMGVAFEFPNLYLKQSALSNLHFFASLYKGDKIDPEELLHKVDLLEHKHKKVEAFSKGMKMRLNLCRALIHNPSYLFLDEPTSGLDPLSASKVKQLILDEKEKGRTIFLTTHNMQVVEDICDRVAFIIDGKIALMDSVRNIKLQEGEKKVSVEYFEKNAIKSEIFDLLDLHSNIRFQDILRSGKVETIHTHEADMEDVFIKTTGRSLV